jgi:flagellar biosynthesis/type III secretory pathway protein FliH
VTGPRRGLWPAPATRSAAAAAAPVTARAEGGQWFAGLVTRRSCSGGGKGPTECQRLLDELELVRSQAEQRVRDAATAACHEHGLTLAEMKAAAEGLRLLHRRVLEAATADLRRLGLAIAERIVRAEIEADPGRLTGVVAGVVARHAACARLVVSCHPDQVAVLELACRGAAPNLAVRADAGLAPWDFTVSSDRGEVDGRLATQLLEIERRLDREPLDLAGVGRDS